ncbi:MAG: DUF4118 domain-containing protein [Ottowia sp.]|uniref:DUF4118 domain-containing protein n=1 Tax=Ottowia sp. TaxID=1898956 RepID=UPI003C77F126
MPTSATAHLDDQRPDPDTLLARVQQEEVQARRGRLKIFFGASAGVGKTYAMLSAAHAAQAQGVPLLVGLVETHGRAETQARAAGLPLLPLKEMPHTGRVLKEFDLDAALAFGAAHVGGAAPPLVLLDELAHSNAPGSRHPKRWQDVEELLAAGIDVWSTMNVQHLESLNDVVGGITGIRVRETVPDTLFDAADEVVVVDLPPDELLARLAAGKVYIPQQAERAAAHFFRKGNLIALRELALRRTADRVDSQMQHWRRSADGSGQRPWPTRDALLACIGPGAGGEAVVRSAARLATQTDLPWHAVFVLAPSRQRVSEADRQQALRALKLAQDLGATVATPAGAEVAETLARYAREHNLSRLVLGRRAGRKRWGLSFTERLAELTPDMDVLQVPLPNEAARKSRTPEPEGGGSTTRWRGYAAAAAACGLVAVLAAPLHGVLELTNIVMLFLLAVVGVALRHGRGPATLAAFLGVALFDFFFVPPRLSLNVSDVQYVITFGVMLVVALVIGQLTAGLRAQAEAATEGERRVRGLYQMSRDLSAALMPQQVAEVGARFLRAEFGAKSALLVADDDNRLSSQDGASAEVDMAVAQWSFEKGEPAGPGTHTLPASRCLMLPLKAPMRLRGVLAVQLARAELLAPEQRQLLETCASLLAISLERIHYIQVAQSSTVQIESERLRNSLLSAISHDLRTPLAALVGLADTLGMTPPPLTAPQTEVADAIRASALRMNALVSNLLDMARLESGVVQLRLEWLPLEEVLGSALAACAQVLHNRPVEVQLAPDVPLLHLDATLIERVLVNLLENAVKYTPPATALRIGAEVQDDAVRITVDDDGPGLPPAREDAVFEKFERGSKETATPGIGLGLAICRAIVEAHGGRIHGENRLENHRIAGARFVITLPRGTPPTGDGSELLADNAS